MSLDVIAGSFVPYFLDPLLAVAFGAITFGVWDDRFGIITIAGTGSTYNAVSIVGDIVILKPDGLVFRIGQRGRAFTGVGWSYADDMIVLRGTAPNGISRILLPSLAETDSNTAITFTNFALMPDRVLRFTGNNVTWDPIGGGATTTECVINTLQPGPGRIIPADFTKGQSLWWLIDCGNGKIYLYDAILKAEVSGKRTIFAGGACTCPVYSRKHNIWGNIIGGALTIFANEPEAASVSAPTFSSAPVNGKTRRTISATVLGSVNEPCPDRNVTFSATVGTIPEPTVKTNALGVATTYYYIPFGSSAGQTLTATLTE